MPIYKWKDKKTGVEIEVIREFAEFTVPPTEEEKPKEMDESGFKEAEWERVIGGGVKVIKGDSWGPGKGNWGRGW